MRQDSATPTLAACRCCKPMAACNAPNAAGRTAPALQTGATCDARGTMPRDAAPPDSRQQRRAHQGACSCAPPAAHGLRRGVEGLGCADSPERDNNPSAANCSAASAPAATHQQAEAGHEHPNRRVPNACTQPTSGTLLAQLGQAHMLTWQATPPRCSHQPRGMRSAKSNPAASHGHATAC